MHTLQK